MINGGLYGASLRLVFLGMLVVGASAFLGPVMQAIFAGAALGFVAAGLFLISGNKRMCFYTAYVTLEIIYNSVLPKFFKRTGEFEEMMQMMLKPIKKLTEILGVASQAKVLCACNIEQNAFSRLR